MNTTIGVDLHKCAITSLAFDERGAVIGRKEIATKCRGQIVDYVGSYGFVLGFMELPIGRDEFGRL